MTRVFRSIAARAHKSASRRCRDPCACHQREAAFGYVATDSQATALGACAIGLHHFWFSNGILRKAAATGNHDLKGTQIACGTVSQIPKTAFIVANEGRRFGVKNRLRNRGRIVAVLSAFAERSCPPVRLA